MTDLRPEQRAILQELMRGSSAVKITAVCGTAFTVQWGEMRAAFNLRDLADIALHSEDSYWLDARMHSREEAKAAIQSLAKVMDGFAAGAQHIQVQVSVRAI